MKAILVIDKMPIKCEDCPLHYRKRQEIYRCEMTHKNIRLNSKPSWCPLKELPINKEIKGDWENVVDVWIDGANYGYNKCLNDISGETE